MNQIIKIKMDEEEFIDEIDLDLTDYSGEWYTSNAIQYVENYNNAIILGRVSIDEYIEAISNPNDVTDSKYTEIRKYRKGDTEYDKFKSSCRCYLPNALFNNTRSLDNCLGSTGLLYIDIDDPEFNISTLDRSLYFIAHRSFGGRGYSIFVKVFGVNEINFKQTYTDIVDVMGLTKYYDEQCCNISRVVVKSLDYKIIVNDDCIIYKASVVDDIYKEYTPTNYNVSYKDEVFKNLLPIEFIDNNGLPCAKKRSLYAHAFISVFGKDNQDAKNFYLQCCGLSDQTGRKRDKSHYYKNGNGFWKSIANSISRLETLKNEINIKYYQLCRTWPLISNYVKLNNNIRTLKKGQKLSDDSEWLLNEIKTYKKIVLSSPPGTGKTSVTKTLFTQLNGYVTIAVPTIVLANQQKAIKLCETIGFDPNDIAVVVDKTKVTDEILKKKVVVCCYESLHKFISRGGVVMVDEIQHLLNDLSPDFREYNIHKLEQLLNNFEYIILASGTTLNIEQYPGFTKITYVKEDEDIINLHTNFNLVEVLNKKNTKSLIFNNNKDTNRTEILPLLESMGKKVLVVDQLSKESSEVKTFINDESFGEYDIILATQIIIDGININTTYGQKCNIIFLEKNAMKWKYDYLVQGISRIRQRPDIDVYYNIAETSLNVIDSVPNDITFKIKHYLKEAEELNKKLEKNVNVDIRKVKGFDNSIVFKYNNSYTVSIFGILYKEWMHTNINIENYLESYHIKIVDDGFIIEPEKRSKKNNKEEREGYDLVTELQTVMGGITITNKHPDTIKNELKLLEITDWTTPMERYLLTNNLAGLYDYITNEKLIEIANLPLTTESWNKYLRKINYFLWSNNTINVDEKADSLFPAIKELDRKLTKDTYTFSEIQDVIKTIPKLYNNSTHPKKINEYISHVREVKEQKVGRAQTMYYVLSPLNMNLQQKIEYKYYCKQVIDDSNSWLNDFNGIDIPF